MKQKYRITGMSCAACASHIDKKIRSISGVNNVNVNLLTNSMEVEYDLPCNDEIICAGVKEAGYLAELYTKQTKTKNNDLLKLIISFILLIVLMYVSMYHMLNLPMIEFLKEEANAWIYALIQLILVLPIVIIYRKYYINGFIKLFKLNPNMDSLIAVGSVASLIYGIFAIIRLINHDYSYRFNLYFESAGMILTLVSLGKYFESKSKNKTTKAIEELIKLVPQTALRKETNGESLINIDDVHIGNIIIVKNGDSIPVDGKVISGNGLVNQANITGESMPVEKSINHEVYSSTILMNGYLEIEATKAGNDSTINDIIKLVDEASNSKAPISKLADKIAGIFVPTVMVLSVITFIVNYLINKDFSLSFNFAISVLVIACPCALGLATPVAIMVSSGVGAKSGILIRNAEILEKTSSIDTIVLDKTGTITKGNPVVTSFEIYDSTIKVLSIVYAMELKSSHPLSKAIIEYAKSRYTSVAEIEDYQVSSNCLECTFENKKYIVGNLDAVKDYPINNTSILRKINELSTKGDTIIAVANETDIIGLIGVKDEIKESSYDAIKLLKNNNLDVIMLTGDNDKTAKSIADELGIIMYYANVMPNKKSEIINELKSQGKCVAMVGDGVNDAIALTNADLGISLGAGSDVAITSSDIVLLKNDLMDVVNVINLSKKTLKIIKGNLFWAFFYNLIGIILATGLLYYPLGIKLNPMIASAAMSFSSVFVVGNALRINHFKTVVYNKMVKTKQYEIQVSGMMCEHCEERIKKACLNVSHIVNVVPNYKTNKVIIEYDENYQIELLLKQIKIEIEKNGYVVIG